MSRLRSLLGSFVGMKAVVAVTGAILFGFLVLHVLGNLKTFLGRTPDGVPDVDVYARFLRTMGEPLFPYSSILWMVRIVLLVALVLHVVSVVQLTKMNRAARPVEYVRFRTRETTPAAKWMLISGSLILVFVIFHLAQFTFGIVPLSSFQHGAVYANLYHAFTLPYMAIGYVAAMAIVGSHLFHGVWSFFQTLGIDNPDRNRMLRGFALAAAVLLFIGFSSVPVLFLTGVMPVPPDYAQLPAPYGGGH